VQAFQHGNIQGLPQGLGPRHSALGVLATEVDAHDHEAPEPQSGLLKGDFCHQPRDLLCGPMGDAFNLVRQAIALDNRGRLRSLFGIPLADAICVRSHARRSCSSAASDSRCMWRSSAIAVYATRNTCVRWSRVCPRQTRTNSCATIVSFRSLPSQNPHSVPEHALLPQSTLTWHQRIVGCPTFVVSRGRLRSVGHLWCSCQNWAVVATSTHAVDYSIESSHNATKSSMQ